jgi:hypothetical protein
MRITTFLAAASVVLVGTLTGAQNITYDFDKSALFGSFRTFAWVGGMVLPDQLNHTRVVNAVSNQLSAKGLTRVEPTSSPDLLVAYHAAFDRDLQITGFSSGWGPYRLAGRTATARTEQIVTGTLVVDLVDARTRTIVWRGIASKEVDPSASGSKRDKNITRAAERLFRNYPPVK